MLNIALLIKKYSVPFIFGLIGFVLLLSGLMNNQSIEFLFASIVILGSAVVSALNVESGPGLDVSSAETILEQL